MRVAILGASGLVGATLTEHYRSHADVETVPLIHSTGNAWRLAAAGVKPEIVDLLDKRGLQTAIDGCSHVVNCSRGDNDVMLDGLKNLIAVCRRSRVENLVHLSSVAIYGDLPPPDSVTEIEPGPVAKNTYGWIKLQQDQLVKAAAQNGLPTTILCPPNICGPYSYFLLQLIDALAQGEFALLEDGSACCSTVDVRNLAHAIDLALRNGAAVGRRYFVTDDADVTWARLVAGLTPLLSDPHIASVNTDQLQVPDVVGPKSSVLGSILHLVSSDVREALRKDPLLQRVDVALRGLAGSLGSGVEERLRESIEGPINVTVRTPPARLNLRLCAQQLRGVQHSCDRLKRELGYAPLVDFDTSMRAFRAWYIALAGTDGEGGDLLDHLAVES